MTLETFKFIDLFAGMGGIRIPFDELGGQCVFSSEWDESAQQTYKANFGEKPHGDITEIDPNDIPDHDILLGGFPCQAFSIAGKMKGFQETRGTLFFNVAAILDAKKPSAFMLENVKQLKSHDGGKTYEVIERTLKNLGYHVHVKVLNALDYGLPQLRQRTIIVGFRKNLKFDFPQPFGPYPSLNTILEPEADLDPKLKASDYIIGKRIARLKSQGDTPFYPSIWHENKSQHISVHPYSTALRASASHNYILVNGVRLPSSRELHRLQGYPDTYKIVVSMREVRRQTGNSVPVPMMRAVAQQVISSLRSEKIDDTIEFEVG
jgi:DNA (cytosine-5)-methyltransferase 1